MFQNIYDSKRVLVTGHTGFKGSWLCEWLLSLGAEVTGMSLYIPSSPSHFESIGLSDRMDSYEQDICDLDGVMKVVDKVKPDIVFHLAAQPIVSTSLDDPISTFQTNVMGSANILECLRNASSVQALVMITSDKCYENVEWDYGYREIDPVGGKDPYSASKGAAEIVFHSFYRSFFSESSQIHMATGRAGNVIGGGDWAKDRIVPDCMKAWGEGNEPFIRSPNATRPWQHVLEPLSGYLQMGSMLMQKIGSINGLSFNFGPPSDTVQTVEDLLNEMTKTWPGKLWNRKDSALSSKEAGLLKLNCDLAQSKLSWRPVLNFEETVSLTADWYKTYYSNEKNIVETTREHIAYFSKKAEEINLSWAK